MEDFSFTLRYRLDLREADPDLLERRLVEAGCDDAVAGIGLPGRLALDFTREAESAEAALRSALSDLRRALPLAQLIEASPDYVGLSDVAEMVGVSRQNMRKLMLRHASFPLPVHGGSSSIWHLADLLCWLAGQGYEVDEGLRATAEAILKVNIALAAQRHPLALEEWRKLVA